MDFNENFQYYTAKFEKKLADCYSRLDVSAPSVIREAMIYAVEGGGKRIRPVLCYSTGELLGVDSNDLDEIAVAIETIHSYSLVHDDLPAMDNDDFRRGKLSTHKKFGEANGILAGDALLNFAFEVLFSKNNFTEDYIKAVRYISKCSGYSGMIGGQILDIAAVDDCISEYSLYEIIKNKTARLIQAPIVAASYMSGEKFLKELENFGYELGVLFQITDDIMDTEGTLQSLGKTPHKDEKEKKLTAVSVFGLEKAKCIAENHYNNAKKIIDRIDNNGFLSQFTDALFLRKK